MEIQLLISPTGMEAAPIGDAPAVERETMCLQSFIHELSLIQI